MASISTNVKDASLNYIKMQTTELHVCSQEPTTYSEASLTYSLGLKNSPVISDPTGDPRAITIQNFDNGLATDTGTGTHWALVSALELLATGLLVEGINIAIGYDFGSLDFQIQVTTEII